MIIPLRKIAVALAAALLSIAAAGPAAAAPASATPAQAAPIHTMSSVNGCENALTAGLSICFYNWINWNKGGGFWRRGSNEILSYTGDCASMENHYWHNGGVIYNDPPSSFVINRDGGTQVYEVRFYDWVDCNWEGGYLKYTVNAGSQLVQSDDMNPIPIGNTFYDDQNWYDKVSSVRVCLGPCT